MKLSLQLNLDNMAFEDGGSDEVRRILNEFCDSIPERLVETDGDITLRDFNGNTVGAARITRAS